ncbi:MAG: hypothetical protein COB85_05800 [Bacteroidetes bacterium]|nr:MAG: hypothetical protein COB85_05800 [Bacteroidota bacterium]
MKIILLALALLPLSILAQSDLGVVYDSKTCTVTYVKGTDSVILTHPHGFGRGLKRGGNWKFFDVNGNVTRRVLLEVVDELTFGVKTISKGKIELKKWYIINGNELGYENYNHIGRLEAKLDPRSGNWTRYYTAGGLREVGNKMNGGRNGEWTFYNYDGRMTTRKSFSNNYIAADRVDISYHTNGREAVTTEYKSYCKDGAYKVYNDFGLLIVEGQFTPFLPAEIDSGYVEDFESGDGYWYKYCRTESVKNGVWKTYEKTGDLLRSQTYVNGVLAK